MRTGEKAQEHRRRMDENRLTYKERGNNTGLNTNNTNEGIFQFRERLVTHIMIVCKAIR